MVFCPLNLILKRCSNTALMTAAMLKESLLGKPGGHNHKEPSISPVNLQGVSQISPLVAVFPQNFTYISSLSLNVQ